MKKFVTAVGIIVSVFVITALFVISGLQNEDGTTSPIAAIVDSSNTQPNAKPTPTAYPFYEITIPYLKSREYTSKLSDLTKVSENSTYTSYITNYESDGLQINGLLTIPNGQKPSSRWPAVVFIHGYIPPASYQTRVNYASYVDFIARNGFVVFKIDLRGHAQSEGEPGGAYFSSDYVIDTLNARAALASSDFVNSQKIGLWGHSMAGNVVLRSFAAQPEIPAAVIWAGAVYTYADQREYGINDGSYQPPPNDTQRQRRRQLLRQIHGDFNPENTFWKQVAATNYLSDLQGAIQVHHAVNDNVVNIGYSRNLMKLLDVTSVVHELYEYQNGGHNLTGNSFTQAMQRTVEFYKKNL